MDIVNATERVMTRKNLPVDQLALVDFLEKLTNKIK